MSKQKFAKRKLKSFEKYFMLILIGILFMSIAFADISDIKLTINGTLAAKAQNGIFIYDINKVSSTGLISEEIKYYEGTTLSSTIQLSKTSNSSIIYKIYVYNNTLEPYYFAGVTYSDSAYDNKNIVFELTGIEPYLTTIEAKQSVYFNIEFKYGTTVSTNQTLNSLLNFEFKNEFIKFALEGEEYTAPQGITWEQFIDSQYNTYGFTLVNENVCGPEGNVLLYEDSTKVAKTDVISADSDYIYETLEITLSSTSGSSVTQGDNVTYLMNITTNGTIKTANIQPKVLNSSNIEVGTATVSGSGENYTIIVNTSLLSTGTYKIKILEGAVITDNRNRIRRNDFRTNIYCIRARYRK